METVLRKLIRGESVSDEDLEEALYEMCDNEHASCNEYCLIYSEVLNPEGWGAATPRPRPSPEPKSLTCSPS